MERKIYHVAFIWLFLMGIGTVPFVFLLIMLLQTGPVVCDGFIIAGILFLLISLLTELRKTLIITPQGVEYQGFRWSIYANWGDVKIVTPWGYLRDCLILSRFSLTTNKFNDKWLHLAGWGNVIPLSYYVGNIWNGDVMRDILEFARRSKSQNP